MSKAILLMEMPVGIVACGAVVLIAVAKVIGK